MLASEIARAVIELVRERIHITYNTSTRERIASPSLTLNVFRRFCPLTRVCVCVCLNPRVVTSSGHFDLRYFDTFRSHTSVLSPTPTSAHAVTVTFRDMPHK